jgi:hypothetical protein
VARCEIAISITTNKTTGGRRDRGHKATVSCRTMDNVFVQHQITGLLDTEMAFSSGIHVAEVESDFLEYPICGAEGLPSSYRAKWLDRSS